MKKKYGDTVYVFTGFIAAAALFLALYPVDTTPHAALARNIPGVNTPLVTARLVETRTTRTKTALAVLENPVVPVRIEEDTPGNPVTFYFQPPDIPVVEAPPAINLIVPIDVTYRLAPLKEQQPGRLTLVH